MLKFNQWYQCELMILKRPRKLSVTLGVISKHSTWIRASNIPFVGKRSQQSSENG